MITGNKLAGYKLPIKPEEKTGKIAQGFVTPNQDRSPQVHSIPPKRLMPIIFIPGIMGSNLRMSSDRQKKLNKTNNIAWRPDNLFVTVPMKDSTAAERQLNFDPMSTELDIYDPKNSITGDPNETADMRNKSCHFSGQYSGSWRTINGPLLQSDKPGMPNSKTRDQKARERGWGEVFSSSYEQILSACEVRLNASFTKNFKDSYLINSIANICPSKWEANAIPKLIAINEEMMRNSLQGCWFPVHAMGYNWLKSNRESGIVVAKRINNLISAYQSQGYQCEKVILITHSMGGLVARAAIHSKMGNAGDKVLGIIHGVMPATGAGAAYKRMRCGFEGDGTSVKVLGATGDHVTPVLGNSQGGLELLPSQAYGNNWLQLVHENKVIKSLFIQGDPYEEIYKVSDKWFCLLKEEWINPSRLPGRTLERAYKLLDGAKDFHNSIADTFHEQSYAHYGADPEMRAWHKVVWELKTTSALEDCENLKISQDDGKGNLVMHQKPSQSKKEILKSSVNATLRQPVDPGDQTVPAHSADAQLRCGKFKGIFRQTGYEHQGSYSNEAVIAATIYSLLKIISTMTWSK
jgi:hypothetical protein